MASFGRILDLLDTRYLSLQDVSGNVEPMPTLVPYDKYTQNVIMYRMDTDLDLFMALVQEYTARISQQLGRELWTWCVQWEVDSTGASVPSLKRPRLDNESTEVTRPGPQTKRRKPIIDIFDRRVIDPELMKEDEMLRILIDIVQVESTVVPNFIEFLYRWVDYFEGDGKALKAALKWEIPSLWDFEYHPLILPEEMKKRVKEERAELRQESGQTPERFNAADALAQGSPSKKIREKPDLAAFERQMQESERLQYREVKYGIQPPKLALPIPPLINIPHDAVRRAKYYAACFRSRQRAVALLMEAGLSIQQIGNYEKQQVEHPRDTSEEGDPKELWGLRHYRKDGHAAQEYYKIRTRLQLEREKQKEVAISSKLTFEAEGGATDGRSGRPTIPLTPSYTRRPDMAAEMMARIKAAREKRDEKINFVPTALVGRMKSKIFEGARDRRDMQGAGRLQPQKTQTRRSRYGGAVVLEDKSGSDTDESSDDDDGLDGGAVQPRNHGARVSQPSNSSTTSSGPQFGAQPPQNANTTDIPATGNRPLQPPPSSAEFAEHIRKMTPEQAQCFIPLLSHPTRPAGPAFYVAQASSNQAPATSSASSGRIEQVVPSMPSASMVPTSTTGAVPSNSYSGTTAPSLSRSNPMPLPVPTQMRPPTVAISPSPYQATLPGMQPPHPPPLASPSIPRSIGHPLGQNQTYNQSQQRATSSPYSQTGSSSGPSPYHASYYVQNSLGAFSQPPQITRSQQILPNPTAPQLPHLPPLPTLQRASSQPGPSLMTPQLDILGNHATLPYVPLFPYRGTGKSLPSTLTRASDQPSPSIMTPQPGAPRDHATTPHVPPSPYSATGNGVPPPSLGHTFNVQHFVSLYSHQQQAQVQTPQQQPMASAKGMTHYPVQQPSRQHPPSTRQADEEEKEEEELLNLPTTLSRPSALQPLSRSRPPPITITATDHSAYSQTHTPTTTYPYSPAFPSLAPSLLSTSPFLPPPPTRIPIQLYFPRILLPGNYIGPQGTPLGDDGHTETDALLLGHVVPGSGRITFSRALFMPTGVWTNTVGKIRRGKWGWVETYPHPSNRGGLGGVCHRAAYNKLKDVHDVMIRTQYPMEQREEAVTKRWRASKGPMTQRDRGAVWEGYGVVLERGIGMEKGERQGVFVNEWVVDGGGEMKELAERRRREIEEALAEDEMDGEEDEDM
jgi:hypothetical protein